MLTTAYLFHAEEAIIKEALKDKESIETVTQWAEKNGLQNHPLIEQKLDECKKESVMKSGEELEVMEIDPETEKSPQSCAEQDPGNETDIQPSVDQSSNFKCPKCTKSFIRKNELNVHIAAKHEKKSFTCPKCQKVFAYKTNAKRHENKCNGTKQSSKENENKCNGTKQPAKEKPNKGKGIKCRKCDHVSHNKRELNEHQKFHAGEKKAEKSRGLSCRQCNQSFPDRKSLYLHQKSAHQSGNGVDLKFPWEGTEEPAPWEGDENLKATYMANKEFILGGGENGVVKKTINFPADNSLSIADIVSKLEKITEVEKMSFRFNISVGFILQNIETGDYRYFIPDRNETLFPNPILIGSLEDVDKKMRGKFDNINLFEHLMRQRPNSKWRVVHITNIKVVLYRTSYILN